MASRHANPTLNALPPVVRETLLKCTPIQQRFVMAYCGPAARNGTLAVKLAGNKSDYGTRAALSSNFLRIEVVRNAIDAWMTTFALGAAEITAGIADLAKSSLEPFLTIEPRTTTTKGKGKKAKTTTAGGGIKLREQTDESWAQHAHWIKSVETDPKTGKVTKLQVHDPLRALDLMAKILKLYSDAPQVNLFMYLQNLSDDDLLKEYEQAVRESGLGPQSRMN